MNFYFLFFPLSFLYFFSSFSSIETHCNPPLSPMISSSIEYFKENEPQLFRFWETLTAQQQQALLSQIQGLDLKLLEQQKHLIHEEPFCSTASWEPFTHFSLAGNRQDFEEGKKLIAEGRLGCLILAGGQGTRLKVNGPKGLYPISVIQKKSLFQLCAEKVVAASKEAGRPLQLAIMTSPENDLITRQFFQDNGLFGLDPTQLHFFVQGTLPFLDANGHLF